MSTGDWPFIPSIIATGALLGSTGLLVICPYCSQTYNTAQGHICPAQLGQVPPLQATPPPTVTTTGTSTTPPPHISTYWFGMPQQNLDEPAKAPEEPPKSMAELQTQCEDAMLKTLEAMPEAQRLMMYRHLHDAQGYRISDVAGKLDKELKKAWRQLKEVPVPTP